MKPQKRIRGGKVRWVARYIGADGKERTKTFDFERDAKDWVRDREKEVRDGDWIDPKSQEITVTHLWRSWEQAAHTDGTRKVREQVGRNLGRLADIPIGKLRGSHVRDWQHELRTGRPWVKGCDGLGDTTVRNYSGQLAGCMNMAVSDGLLRKSPCAGIATRRRGDKAVTRAEILTGEQVWLLADAARQGVPKGRGAVPAHPTLARMIVVGAATGLRAGELAGLRIRSVDFLRKEATISEQSKTGTSEFSWAPLKTKMSRRLPLPDVALEALAKELEENPCADRSMPIFRTVKGQMWSSSTLGKSFKLVRDRLGMDEEITWHSLRHFYASTLIFSGASVKTVQERLGHSTPTTTLEVYAHLWPGEDERTRSAVDSALGRDQVGTEGEAEGSETEAAPAASEGDGGSDVEERAL
ncbi:tyrosine-type recombinase/integrase [Rhodococcus pyridinivorans]|uniref:tyrosine-type recombinase/integrase n=2 Tax=Rhodococcus pyridinivorans TaxID=103816 RepID=UPI001E4A2A56|nr:site-specific integrase [Rhodococcus pyridinivorans]MCD2139489.1 site-specific integrase [Rhodococcus pyridinivorans]